MENNNIDDGLYKIIKDYKKCLADSRKEFDEMLLMLSNASSTIKSTVHLTDLYEIQLDQQTSLLAEKEQRIQELEKEIERLKINQLV